MELAEAKIRVNAIAPAVVDTPVYEGFIPKEQVPDVMRGFDAFHPVGRVGRVEDVVNAIEFFSRIARAGSPARSGTLTAA